MRGAAVSRTVTPVEWTPNLQHPSYGWDDTYHKIAAWLQDCASVADWGGGTGFLRTFLRPSMDYRLVDGTLQSAHQTLADLRTYRVADDGIVLRHVLEHNEDWRTILANALDAFQRRLVVVTFTPDAPVTGRVKYKSGWPIIHFNPADLRAVMGASLVSDEVVMTSHPERVFYVERRR